MSTPIISSTASQLKLEDFSVLMSVYYREKPEDFSQSLYSIFHQTLIPSEVVLICDGPLTEELDRVIATFQSEYCERLRVFRIEKNGGLGKALNKGLALCSFDLVARMDADDFSLPTRFEKQIRFMTINTDVDVLSCAIDEFTNDKTNTCYRRVLPTEHDELVRYAKLRTPVNHPSVVFRKKAVLAAGGYQHFYLFEDYYLWVRMIMNGAKFHALPDSLLCFRMDTETYGRRKGSAYNKSEIQLQKEFLKMGFINRWEFVRNVLVRTVPRLLPRNFLKCFYRVFLRKPIANNP